MVIEDRDLFDLRQQFTVDLLNIRPRERCCLAECRRRTERCQRAYARRNLRSKLHEPTSGVLLVIYLPARAPCHAEETLWIRSTASFRLAVDEANENRTKSALESPNAAPGMAATPASSSITRQTSSAVMPVP